MMSKTELRSEYRRRRELLSEDTRDVLSGQAVSQLLSLPEIKNAKVIFCYISFGAELSTLALLESLLAAGKIVCVPHISGKEKLPMSFSGLKECTVGAFWNPGTCQGKVSAAGRNRRLYRSWAGVRQEREPTGVW